MNGSPAKARFLSEINCDLPPGVDWKAGAVEYMSSKVKDHGPGIELYHLNKPFHPGRPDHEPFVNELSRFVAMVGALNLSPKARVLDVGTGPGWVAHYFAKLGFEVLGIDICADLLDIARRRVRAEPFEVLPGVPLRAEFELHDIEEGPLPGERRFDIAYLESALHHFYDPVSALNNLAQSLETNGMTVILEETAAKDSPGERERIEIMTKYHTLERPYSRRQLAELLALCGFHHHRFLYPLCGMVEQTAKNAERVRQLVSSSQGFNFVVASTSADALSRLRTDVEGAPAAIAAGPIQFGEGFYEPEWDSAGRLFRWCRGTGQFTACDARSLDLHLGCYPPALKDRIQTIAIRVNGSERERIALSSLRCEQRVRLGRLPAGSSVGLESDVLFHPRWFGLDDARDLSFWVRFEL